MFSSQRKVAAVEKANCDSSKLTPFLVKNNNHHLTGTNATKHFLANVAIACKQCYKTVRPDDGVKSCPISPKIAQ